MADENSIESTWALMGLSCRLAQSVCLLLLRPGIGEILLSFCRSGFVGDLLVW